MKHVILSAILLLTACGSPSAPDDKPAKDTNPVAEAPATPNIIPEKLRDGFYLLKGPGGNVLVSVGEDGVFVVDDKYDRFGDEIITVIQTLSDKPIKFVANTHYHGDHTGANAHMHKVGATVIAHDNVRERMGKTFHNHAFDREVKAADEDRWPNLTMSERATLHFNGHTIDMIHVPNAHTDGDSLIYFREANILHMGDNFFHGLFPYVDVDGGGSINGMIAAHQTGLDLSDADTIIMPGHGAMTDKSGLAATQAQLKVIRDRVQTGINTGKSTDDLIHEKILSDMAGFSSFIDEENMIRIAYRSLSQT